MVDLVVETGAGVVGANTYTSLADANTYFEDRDLTAWEDAPTSERNPSLVRATQIMEAMFGDRYLGKPVAYGQSLSWPRRSLLSSAKGPLDDNGYEVPLLSVPLGVKYACMEAAYLLMTTGSFGSPSTLSRDDFVKSKTVDVLTTTYFDNAPSIPTYPFIAQLLDGVTNSGGAPITMRLGNEVAATTSNDPFDFPKYFDIVKFGA